MTNQQLTGMNQNPVHVLSAGAGDLLQVNNGVGSGQMSPTYQDMQFHTVSKLNQGVADPQHRKRST